MTSPQRWSLGAGKGGVSLEMKCSFYKLFQPNYFFTIYNSSSKHLHISYSILLYSSLHISYTHVVLVCCYRCGDGASKKRSWGALSKDVKGPFCRWYSCTQQQIVRSRSTAAVLLAVVVYCCSQTTRNCCGLLVSDGGNSLPCIICLSALSRPFKQQISTRCDVLQVMTTAAYGTAADLSTLRCTYIRNRQNLWYTWK